MTCKKAQEFLAQKEVTAASVVNARKEQFDRARTLELLQPLSEVVAVKGKKILRFSLQKGHPPPDVLLSAVLGPSGNLRAPTVRAGKRLVVGFHPDVYGELFG